MATELRTRSLVVLGLSSLAVAQPLLDLFGRNPEFFVAGNYSTAQIIWFALLITLVPPLVGIAAIAVATLINRRAGTIVYGIVVAILGAAFVLAVLRTIGVDPVVLVSLVALAGGVAAVVLAAAHPRRAPAAVVPRRRQPRLRRDVPVRQPDRQADRRRRQR